MTAVARRFEALASRSSALMERQGEVFHRFIACLQSASSQIESLTFGEMAYMLEKVIKEQEIEAEKELKA